MIWEVVGKSVTIDDWDSALDIASKLDRLKPGEDRSLINGRIALRIVAEYGLLFYQSAHPGEETNLKLAIVIDEITVYVIPSEEGLDGVFIGEYWLAKYGKWAHKLTKESLWNFTNIDARLDGFSFFADMLTQSQGRLIA
jgi:hypothetical protein